MNCYRLPEVLSDWALSLVGLAVQGIKLFPADVIFLKHKDEIFADILN